MEKETFILQTTVTGRLPTNAVFVDEKVARLETERAEKSRQFEHIKLVHLVGTDKRVLLEIGKPSSGKGLAGKGKPGKPEPARAKKKQVTPAQLINRISLLVTLGLIGGVVYYAAQYFMTK
jgi:hypothetical protein